MDDRTRLRQLGFEPPSEPADNDIAALEDDLGVPLPARYREFLAGVGGWYGDFVCPCREPTPFGEHHGRGFHDAGAVRGLLDSLITPRNMITIGWGNFSMYTCLSIAGIDRGSVYALDGDFRVYWSDEEFHLRFNAMADEIREYLRLRREDQLPEKPIGYDSLYLVAEDFDEFLDQCQASEDE